MKTCTKCGRRQPYAEFYRLPSGSLRADCRTCCTARANARNRARAAELEALRAARPVLTPVEEDIVRSAADWLETPDALAAADDVYARVEGLLIIIDRLVPQGAVRLDQAPQGADRG